MKISPCWEYKMLKDSQNEVRRQSTEWKKIFADHVSDSNFYPQYTKNPTTIKRQSHLNMNKEFKIVFPKNIYK
jgi:hypothetical protein